MVNVILKFQIMKFIANSIFNCKSIKTKLPVTKFIDIQILYKHKVISEGGVFFGNWNWNLKQLEGIKWMGILVNSHVASLMFNNYRIYRSWNGLWTCGIIYPVLAWFSVKLSKPENSITHSEIYS